MKDLLIVEDDPTLGEGIRLALQAPELRPQLCRSLADAGELLSRRSFDLLILDINLPDGNGLDLLRALRRESEVPVILLTANDLETDIVAGLELGADDYITKPFSLAVLRARVNTQLRRTAAPQAERVHYFQRHIISVPDHSGERPGRRGNAAFRPERVPDPDGIAARRK